MNDYEQSPAKQREQRKRRYEQLLGTIKANNGVMIARQARRTVGKSGFDHSRQTMLSTQQAAIEQDDIIQFAWGGLSYLALTDRPTLTHLQRTAGQRGEKAVVAKCQRLLQDPTHEN